MTALELADTLMYGSHSLANINNAADMLRRQHAEITALRTLLDAPAGEPVSHQYQDSSGKWCNFMNESHYVNTKADGRWPIRALYAAPQAQQPAVQCKHCTKFFSAYRCNAPQGECDCPKCQGFCTCSQQPRKAVKLTTDDWYWVCNECGSPEYTSCVSEADIQELGCGNCGGDEWHKEPMKDHQ